MSDTVDKLLDVIIENFPNGIRDDFIDINKVIQMYSEKHSNEKISLDEVQTIIRSKGIELDGRIYFVTEDDIEIILFSMEELTEERSIVYYSVLFKKQEKFFSNLHVPSPALLKKILQDNEPRYHYAEEFFSTTSVQLADEIAAVFSSVDQTLSATAVQEKLPYVPSERINAVLSDGEKYLPTTEGTFIPVGKLQFDMEELESAKEQMTRQLKDQKFVEPENFLPSNLALNAIVIKKDLLNAIYRKFFLTTFIRRGNKFFNKDTPDSRDEQNSFDDEVSKLVAERDEINISEIKEFAQKKCVLSPQFMINVLAHVSKFMVRVSENLFVKDSLIKFRITETDAALKPFVREKIIPLRAVSSFTGFPPVAGYSWNLFMLKSFLIKYSKKYICKAIAVNGNIGAIYPRTMTFENYFDVQVAAVLQNQVPLKKLAVGQFLVEQGYRKKNLAGTIDRIILRARELLNRRDV